MHKDGPVLDMDQWSKCQSQYEYYRIATSMEDDVHLIDGGYDAPFSLTYMLTTCGETFRCFFDIVFGLFMLMFAWMLPLFAILILRMGRAMRLVVMSSADYYDLDKALSFMGVVSVKAARQALPKLSSISTFGVGMLYMIKAVIFWVCNDIGLPIWWLNKGMFMIVTCGTAGAVPSMSMSVL